MGGPFFKPNSQAPALWPWFRLEQILFLFLGDPHMLIVGKFFLFFFYSDNFEHLIFLVLSSQSFLFSVFQENIMAE